MFSFLRDKGFWRNANERAVKTVLQAFLATTPVASAAAAAGAVEWTALGAAAGSAVLAGGISYLTSILSALNGAGGKGSPSLVDPPG